MSSGEDVRKLLQRYVELHNSAVQQLDAPGASALLLDGVTIQVEGESLSRLRREAIVRSFAEHEVLLWKIGNLGDDVAFANYAWRDHPRIGGLIRLQREGDSIRELTLRPGYSRVFGMLAGARDPGPFAEVGGPSAFSASGPPS